MADKETMERIRLENERRRREAEEAPCFEWPVRWDD
jgi:hypothetical protein